MFEFTCALEEAARAIGLPSKIAYELALQTVTGAARLVESASKFHPKELRIRLLRQMGLHKQLKVFPLMNCELLLGHAVEVLVPVPSSFLVSNFNNGTLVVTGGAGLIGSAIIWGLNNRDWKNIWLVDGPSQIVAKSRNIKPLSYSVIYLRKIFVK